MTVKWLRVVKLAAAILEFAEEGRIQSAHVTAGSVNAPLVPLRIIETQRQQFEVAGLALDLEPRQIGTAISPFAYGKRAVILPPRHYPVSGCCKRDM